MHAAASVEGTDSLGCLRAGARSGIAVPRRCFRFLPPAHAGKGSLMTGGREDDQQGRARKPAPAVEKVLIKRAPTRRVSLFRVIVLLAAVLIPAAAALLFILRGPFVLWPPPMPIAPLSAVSEDRLRESVHALCTD